MTEVKIDLKLSGFPVKIGDMELWFSTSVENLRSFFNAEDILQEKLKEAEEKAMHIHFPDDVNDYDLGDYTEKDIKNVDAALDLKKEFVAAQYDILFGDGTFKKIYEKYPDMEALEQAIDPLGLAIAKKIDEFEKERSSKVSEMKKEALKKQQAKKK